MKNILALIVTLALLSGCSMQREYESDDSSGLRPLQNYTFSSNSDDAFVDIVESKISGDIGDIEDIDNSPAAVSGYDEGEHTSIELIMTSTRGSAMVALSLYGGGITSDELVVGSVHQFVPSSAQREGSDLHAEAIVCSGAMPGEWTYDDIVNQLEIRVEQAEASDEVPAAKRINFTTTTEEDVATGHIDIVVFDKQ